MQGTRMPRGALPSPRSRLAAAMPHSIVGTTPPNYFVIPKQLEFWGNNTYGDCVTAEEAFAKACHNPEILISDQEAVDWATQNNCLNGAIIVDVLDLMMTKGFVQNGHTYDDGPHVSVDWTNTALLQNAISRGPVKIGVAADQLNNVWTGVNGWFATGFYQDNNEDHCVSLCGYGTMAWLAQQLQVQVPAGVNEANPGYGMFTWDTVGIIDEPSLRAITHEAWLRHPTTRIR